MNGTIYGPQNNQIDPCVFLETPLQSSLQRGLNPAPWSHQQYPFECAHGIAQLHFNVGLFAVNADLVVPVLDIDLDLAQCVYELR